MKAITVQLPWAVAIASGVKLVENRASLDGWTKALALARDVDPGP